MDTSALSRSSAQFCLYDRCTLRRISSILLLLLYWLGPFIALLPASAESRLPPCCRRNGAHHCTMNMAERMGLESGAHHFAAPSTKCPRCPTSVRIAPTQAPSLVTNPARVLAASSHPNGVPQSESRRRISRDRSRLKRGPPQLHLL